LGELDENIWKDNEYTLLNTDKWKVPDKQIILKNKCQKCEINPTIGYPVDLKDFDNTLRLQHEEKMDLDYFKEKLNI
jgi:hypothetical protein